MQPYQAAKRFYEDNEPDYKRQFAPPADTTEIQSLGQVLGPADPASNQVRNMGEASEILASFYLVLMRAETLCNDSVRLYPTLRSERFIAANFQSIAYFKSEYMACQTLLSNDPERGMMRVWEQRQSFILATLQFHNLEMRIATLASMHIQ